MFARDSRYRDLATLTRRLADGREVVYKARRFVPPPASLETQAMVTMTIGSRLDLVAARWLGDPLLSWRVADANRAMDPFELETPGRRLRVPSPSLERP